MVVELLNAVESAAALVRGCHNCHRTAQDTATFVERALEIEGVLIVTDAEDRW